jgi:SAM-dependent methyltransferase
LIRDILNRVRSGASPREFHAGTGGVDFRCNICGAFNRGVPADRFERETPTCMGCHSSVRMRGIIHHLSVGLFGRSLPVSEFPESNRVGIGLSDWEGYADRLARRLVYTNTFYHREPLLDIVAPPPERIGTADFLISTDVFEHVPPPVSRAFRGAYDLLKPGGLLVLTVPFTDVPETVEHFPNLHVWKVVELGAEDFVLVNRDATGNLSARSGLCFHGGPGDTLEMRVFSRADTVRLLEEAGFVDIEVHEGEVPQWGILPPHGHGLPITAKKPKGS